MWNRLGLGGWGFGGRIMLGVVGCLIAATSWADDFDSQRAVNWHQWRGPDATGVAAHGDPPANWDEQANTNIKWKVAIPGRGTSTPVIWGDRIFILTAIKTDRQAEVAEETADASPAASPFRFAAQTESAPPAAQEQPQRRRRGGFGRRRPAPTNFHQFVVMCLDRRTGDTLWQKVASEAVPHEGHHQSSSYAAASPITDGQYVYASFGSYGIYCYDMEGNFKWGEDLGDFRMRGSFGEGTSPALSGDTLIVNCDHEGQSQIFALNARTGDEKWHKDREESSTWNTPLITEYNGRKQVIVNGMNRTRSYDLATGDIVWECGGQTANPIPSPMRIDDLAICISGFRGYAAFAIPLSSSGDLTDTDQPVWHLDKGTPYVASAALVGDRLYYTKDRAGILSCVNARTGEVIIDQKRLPGMDDVYASPVAAAGRVYFTARNGNTVVIDATSDQVDVIAENHLDETIAASPAIVGGAIFIRGENSLYCITE